MTYENGGVNNTNAASTLNVQLRVNNTSTGSVRTHLRGTNWVINVDRVRASELGLQVISGGGSEVAPRNRLKAQLPRGGVQERLGILHRLNHRLNIEVCGEEVGVDEGLVEGVG